MKAWIQTTPYFEYEVIDVYLGIKSMDELILLQGFDDGEWREAEQFAQNVATALGIEYIGYNEVIADAEERYKAGEANHEMPEWSNEH